METVETPQPTAPVEQKSTDWTKIILAAVLGFILLAGSAYAGYWYGTQQVPQSEEPAPVVSPPTPVPTPTPVVEDETKGWEAYRNGDGGYEVEYPPVWNMSTSQYNPKEALFGPGATSSGGYGGVEVREWDRTLDEWVSHIQRNADIKYSDIERVDISGNSGVKATSEGSVSGRGRAVLVKKGNYVYNVHVHYYIPDLDEEECIRIFDLMLSTFKFLD